MLLMLKHTCTTILVRGSGGEHEAAPCARARAILWNSLFICSSPTSSEQTCKIARLEKVGFGTFPKLR